MKKNFIKTAFAVVCVVAAGIGGYKAYSAANQSETNQLLTENVEALSQSEIINTWCKVSQNGVCQGATSMYCFADNIRVPGWWP